MKIKNRFFYLLILVAFIVITSAFAIAKCPTLNYKIKGNVVGLAKVPIRRADILVFFDEDEIGYEAETSKDGNFELECYYETYIGQSSPGRDECGKEPSYITVVIHLDGYSPRKFVFNYKDVIENEKGKLIIILPINLVKDSEYFD